MLSDDELANGSTFILKLRDAAGTPVQWAQSLKGAVARRWYDIYRTSDWAALRLEASGVFRTTVTETEAEEIGNANRCVVIRPQNMKVSELTPAAA